MKLNKLLLFAAAGVVAYKVLSRVKIVKVEYPEELPQEFELAAEVMGEVYGKKFAKDFKKAMQDNGNKTNMNVNEKIIKLASERPITIHDASYEAAKLIREYKEVSE